MNKVIIDEHYTATITPEEHNWEVILGQLEPTPTEEDFNSWTDRRVRAMKDKVTREQLEEARKYLAKFNTKKQ